MSDPGTGKTRPAIENWAERRRKGGGKALAICVKSNMEAVWQEQLAEWAPDVIPSLAYATNRELAFKAPHDVAITNTDAAIWLAKKRPSFFADYDTLIVDESTYFKHRTSQRSRGLEKISRESYGFEFVELMSGTPNPNTILDIWHQVFILDRGESLGSRYHAFRQAVCDAIPTGYKRHVKWVDKPHAHEAVFSMIGHLSIRHLFDECLDIPPMHNNVIRYSLPKKLYAQYLKLQEEAVLELKKAKSISAVNQAVLQNKLLQLCSGAVYNADGDYVVLDKDRYQLVCDLIEERQHSVTFFVWRHQRDMIAEELEKRKLPFAVIDGNVTRKGERMNIVRRFQQGEYRTLLLHPKTGAHGLTLTTGKSVIWPSPIFEADLFLQGNQRIRRIGQDQKTEVVTVGAKRTIEPGVYLRREAKNRRMLSLLDMIAEVNKDESHLYLLVYVTM
jgi:hypothetical protein